MGGRSLLSRLLLAVPAIVLIGTGAAVAQEAVTLRMILVAPEDRWNTLLEAAQEKFAAEHPDIELSLDVQILPFADRLTQLRAAAIAGTPLDIVSLDQPEVGDFAAAGFTSDLTERIDQDLDGLSDWLPAYREATRFEGGWHAIWAWTDARVMWYWKDLVAAAGIDPATDMATWQSYLESCQKLDEAVSDQGASGCLLIGQPWIADWTFPYVWMSQGDIGFAVNAELAEDQGAAEAWVPSLASEAWIEALQFTRDQVDAGIEPFTEHQFGTEFVNRSFAVSLDGTWVLGALKGAGADLGQVGMIGAFPVPSADTTTATMAGGWTLAIPSTSENPDVAWDFLKAMLDISTLGRLQTEFGYLPTRASFTTGAGGAVHELLERGRRGSLGGADRAGAPCLRQAELSELAAGRRRDHRHGAERDVRRQGPAGRGAGCPADGARGRARLARRDDGRGPRRRGRQLRA